jgi:hypothetical protein
MAAASMRALLILINTVAASQAADQPTTNSPSQPSRPLPEPSTLDLIVALLFGSSNYSFINALSLGEPPLEGVRHLCRYERPTQATVMLALPGTARFVILSPNQGVAFFLTNGTLTRQSLDANGLPTGVAQPVVLAPETALDLLVGITMVGPPRLIAVDRSGVLITIDPASRVAVEMGKSVPREAMFALSSQSIAPDGTVALAEVPRAGTAQLELLPNGEQTTEPQLLARLEDRRAPVTVSEPRWSDDGRYLTYVASCVQGRCCPD